MTMPSGDEGSVGPGFGALRELLASARFPLHEQGGYDPRAVDELLDRLTAALAAVDIDGRRVPPAAEPAPPDVTASGVAGGSEPDAEPDVETMDHGAGPVDTDGEAETTVDSADEVEPEPDGECADDAGPTIDREPGVEAEPAHLGGPAEDEGPSWLHDDDVAFLADLRRSLDHPVVVDPTEHTRSSS